MEPHGDHVLRSTWLCLRTCVLGLGYEAGSGGVQSFEADRAGFWGRLRRSGMRPADRVLGRDSVRAHAPKPSGVEQ